MDAAVEGLSSISGRQFYQRLFTQGRCSLQSESAGEILSKQGSFEFHTGQDFLALIPSVYSTPDWGYAC